MVERSYGYSLGVTQEHRKKVLSNTFGFVLKFSLYRMSWRLWLK